MNAARPTTPPTLPASHQSVEPQPSYTPRTLFAATPDIDGVPQPPHPLEALNCEACDTFFLDADLHTATFHADNQRT